MLPDEVLTQVFHALSFRDKLAACHVCRKFNAILATPQVRRDSFNFVRVYSPIRRVAFLQHCNMTCRFSIKKHASL